MKSTINIKTIAMKKLLFLLLLFTSIAYAQPNINQPSDFSLCDEFNDGYEMFDLNTKNYEILGALNPNEYNVSYYPDLVSAQNNTNPFPSIFLNSNPNMPLPIYCRVEEIANTTNYATTYFMLTLVQGPNILTPSNLTQFEDPFDGFSQFDLTTQNNAILNGLNPADHFITYYNSYFDAQNLTNQIINPNSFVNYTNPQTIYVRVSNIFSSCNSITSFTIEVIDSSQIIYIPDANFKAKLVAADVTNGTALDLNGNNIKIDSNNDLEIQVSEALNVVSMHVDESNIADMTGVTSFYNLINLTCQENQITALNVSGLNQLNTLLCSNNVISNLNLTGLNNLEFLYCAYNQLTNLDLSYLTNLRVINCSNNLLTTITNIDTATNLEDLDCSFNQLNSLSPSNPHINTINCQNNPIVSFFSENGQLSVLNITNCPALQAIFCGGNAISTLDLSGKPNLTTVWCELNQITTLDVTGSPNLQSLSCRNNLITNLDLTNNIALTDLNCGVNLMTTLDVSHCVNLINFHCHTLPITTLDVSNNPNLCNFLCIYNNNLTTLNIKNGNNTCYTQFGIENNPSLQFVCTDDDEAAYFQNYFGSSIVVNTYCSFNPSGDYNTITGTIRFDGDNNGCDATDLPQPNIRMDMTQWGMFNATFTNTNGNYTFYTTNADQLVAPSVENPLWFNFTPQDAVISFIDTNLTATQDFCLSANGVHNDLEVVIAPITPARPGFNAVYKLVYKNKGNTIPGFNSGVRLDFNPNQMSFVSASQTVGTQDVNFVNFDYSNLLPFESREITVTFHINAPTDANPVNIGDILNLHSNVGLNIGDENPADNDFYYSQVVVGSFDPNDITCLEGEVVAPTEIGKYLHYLVNFENTGTFMAENVVVKTDINPAELDVSSLQLLNTSHSCYVRIINNKVEFVFENINLEEKSGNPPVGGHGNVLFKIKSNNELTTNDFVTNAASIFFDYNFPIDTNLATTTFATLSNTVSEIDESISVYPNPTNSIININCKNTIKSIELYDVQGRILQTVLENATSSKIDITNKTNGIYFLKINTIEGSKVEKIMKE